MKGLIPRRRYTSLGSRAANAALNETGIVAAIREIPQLLKNVRRLKNERNT
jgi:hypothetical protein